MTKEKKWYKRWWAITILVFALFTILTYNGVVFRDYDYFALIIVLLLIIIAQNTEKKNEQK